MTIPQTPRLTDEEIEQATGKPTVYGFTFYVTSDVKAALDAQLAKTQADYQGLVLAAETMLAELLEDLADQDGEITVMPPAWQALRDELRKLGVE